MTIATVTTDINIGSFKIPSNGQGMIMNNYAQRENIKVDITIPEPLMSKSLSTVQWMHKKFKLSKIILCSIHQLPTKQKDVNKLLSNLRNVEFHFALEGIKGKGNKFLKNVIKEAKIFRKASIIESSETNWIELFEMIQKKSKKKN